MVKICYNLFTTMSFKQFRPGFQQESILLHIGNVENYVENVENTVESRGNNKKLLVQRTFYSGGKGPNIQQMAGENKKMAGIVTNPKHLSLLYIVNNNERKQP